ncbi:MAG: hypothetical protein QXN87_03520 [Candidatus Bathyarchaeia archaeon]
MAAIKQVRQVLSRGKSLKDEKTKTEEFYEEKSREIELMFWYETRPEGP